MMTLSSLFDGSGGFPLAGALSGIRPVWAAEVEPYPIAVTRSRFPMMQHLGSVTGGAWRQGTVCGCNYVRKPLPRPFCCWQARRHP